MTKLGALQSEIGQSIYKFIQSTIPAQFGRLGNFRQHDLRRLFKAFFTLQVNDIAIKPLLPVLPFPVPESKPVATTEAMTQMKPIAQARGPTLTKPKVWNTKSLGLRLASDAVSGICAAALVAPVITAVDKAIMQNASGQASLKESIKTSMITLLLRPHNLIFSKPFALICMVYGGTYLTANTVDTLSATVKNRSASHITSGTTKFAASSAANVGLCLAKDRAFVQLFGSGGPPRPVPLPSFALFTLRDCLTIFASFNLPPLLGPVISRNIGKELEKSMKGQAIAQFVAPASIQLLSTPMHLLGLDLYNRGEKLPWSERWQLVKKNWVVSTAARICRIVPAFGVGGVMNQKVRKSLIGRLE